MKYKLELSYYDKMLISGHLRMTLRDPKSEATIRWALAIRPYKLSELRYHYKYLKSEMDEELKSPSKRDF